MFYIYEHVRNDTGKIFYVGKGQKERALQTKGRNPYWNKVVNKAGGFTINYYQKNIPTEEDAYALETERIAELKSKGVKLTNISNGGEGFESGAKHPGYGKHRSDYDNAKVRLGHLKSSKTNAVDVRIRRGKTMYRARGTRSPIHHGKQTVKELGTFPMKHEAEAVAQAEKNRLIDELSTFIFEIDSGLEPSKSYLEIIDGSKGLTKAGVIKIEWGRIKHNAKLAQKRGDIERYMQLEDLLIELQDMYCALNPSTPTCRTYEEERDVQQFLKGEIKMDEMNEFYVTGRATRVIKGVNTPEDAKREFINLIGYDQDVEVYDMKGEQLL